MTNKGFGGNKDLTYQFPDFNIKESQKDEDWHKKCVMAITNQSLHNSYDLYYDAINESYEFYQGLDVSEEFKFLQEAEDGDVLPASWINYNKIKVKIDLLIGELSERGYKLNVTSINKDAKIRKLQKKEETRVDMRMSKFIDPLQQSSGVPLMNMENLPQDEEELDEFFNYNYKEKSEVFIQFAIKWLSRVNDWDYERIALFRDLCIAGRCFVKLEIVKGIPRARRVDPRYMIFDTNATDDFLSDSSFFGEVRYMPINDLADEYNITKSEIEEVYRSHNESQKLNIFTQGSTYSEGLLGNTNLKFFKRERGELRVLVVSAVWADTKPFNYKESEDKYGTTHYKKVGDSDSKNVKKRRIGTWRRGTLIGGEIFKEWGEIDNQVRSVDDLHDSRCPYKCLIPNYINGHGVSKVEQLKGLQKLKDIALYNVQLEMARAGTKGFYYDISQLPDEWDIETALKYLKTTGIAFIDSKKDGVPSSFNQFQQIDMTLSDSITRYIGVSEMVDREMDAISGINEARQGIVKNASQAVGVTQSALMQSSMSTQSMFKLFSMFSNHVWTYTANLVRIAAKDSTKFAPILGDVGFDFINNDLEVDLNDYDVFIESIPPVIEDTQMYYQMVQSALAAGSIDFRSAIKLLMEKDPEIGVKKFERALVEQEKKQERMMQQQQEQQMAMQQQQAQADQQGQMMDQQGKMAEIQLENEGKRELELIKARVAALGKRFETIRR